MTAIGVCLLVVMVSVVFWQGRMVGRTVWDNNRRLLRLALAMDALQAEVDTLPRTVTPGLDTEDLTTRIVALLPKPTEPLIVSAGPAPMATEGGKPAKPPRATVELILLDADEQREQARLTTTTGKPRTVTHGGTRYVRVRDLGDMAWYRAEAV